MVLLIVGIDVSVTVLIRADNSHSCSVDSIVSSNTNSSRLIVIVERMSAVGAVAVQIVVSV